MLDQTPLIDIKPFIHHTDNQYNVKSGWLDKHFSENKSQEEIFKNIWRGIKT